MIESNYYSQILQFFNNFSECQSHRILDSVSFWNRLITTSYNQFAKPVNLAAKNFFTHLKFFMQKCASLLTNLVNNARFSRDVLYPIFVVAKPNTS